MNRRVHLAAVAAALATFALALAGAPPSSAGSRSQRRAPASRKRGAAASAGSGRHQTVVLRARRDKRGFAMIPREVEESLEALAKRHGDDLRPLRTSEMGSDLFASQLIYRVRDGLRPELAAAIRGQGVSMTSLRTILRARPSGKPVDDATVRTLEGGALGSKTRALLDVQRALETAPGERGALPADPELRDRIGDATWDAVATYANLFNATLLEATRPRREQLLAEAEAAAARASAGTDKGEGFGQQLNRYFDASARAIDELRSAGGTPELTAIGGLLARSTEVLDRLGTPRSHGLLTALMEQGNGAVLEVVVRRSATGKRLIDGLLEAARSRVEQTGAQLATLGRPGSRPEGARGNSSSGPYQKIGGGYQTESVYAWSPDVPFEDLSNNPFLLLGTELAPYARHEITRFFLDADRALPEMAANHRESYVLEQMRAWAGADADGEHAAGWREHFGKEYDKHHAFTGVSDVRQLAYGLTALPARSLESPAFSRRRLAQESMEALTLLLGQVRTPQMHRLLADVALHALDRYSDADLRDDRGLRQAAVAMAHRLLEPGPDSEVRFLAAASFGAVGMKEMLPHLIEGLASPAEDVRRFTIDAIVRIASPERATDAPGRAPALLSGLRLKGSKRPLDAVAALRGAIPQLSALVAAEREIVWIRIAAVEALSSVDPSNQAPVELLRRLMVDDGAIVAYSEDQRGPKNMHVQVAAIEALGRFGAHARGALPALSERIEIGGRAQQVVELVGARRQEAGGDDKYSLQHDDVAVAKVRPLLREIAARSEHNPARSALEFLNDSNSPDLRQVPSYQRRDYPSAEQVLHEVSIVGRAAEKAREQIDNK